MCWKLTVCVIRGWCVAQMEAVFQVLLTPWSSVSLCRSLSLQRACWSVTCLILPISLNLTSGKKYCIMYFFPLWCRGSVWSGSLIQPDTHNCMRRLSHLVTTKLHIFHSIIQKTALLHDCFAVFLEHKSMLCYACVLCVQILKELPEVEAQLQAKGSALIRSYTTSLSLYVVGVLRRYHCCLLCECIQYWVSSLMACVSRGVCWL